MTEDRLEKIPKPKSKEYELRSIEHVNHNPHPYCLTPKHVAHCSDNNNGMLNKRTIKDAEKAGAKCGMYTDGSGRWSNGRTGDCTQRCLLPHSEHVSDTVLLIKALVHKPINELEGMQEYLNSISAKLGQLKIDGVAFIEPD